MIGKRELTTGDYLAMLRRRIWVIVIPTLIAAPVALLISFAFPPRFNSKTLMLVQEQAVPEGFVKPGVTKELTQRVTSLRAKVLSRDRLLPVIDRYGLQKRSGNILGRFLGDEKVDDVVDDMRDNVIVNVLQTSLITNQRMAPSKGEQVAGFYIEYSNSSPALAQKICNELAAMFVDEDLRLRQQSSQGTTEFLRRQVEEAKRDLDAQDAKLAAFKTRYFGQLPDQQQDNLKVLSALNSQLDATTQTLNRAQQDKAYSETMLSQSLADLKASQSNTDDPKALKQQMASLQGQLITLQARYTDEYPEVIKTKKDLEEVKRKLDEANSPSPQASEKKAAIPAKESPDIVKLRAQLQQDNETITQSTAQQQRIQERINLYQSRLELTPGVEEQYKKLTRDYDTSQKFYSGLLDKKSESEMTSDMERRQQGEQIRVQDAATFPDAPSFPERPYFGGGGLAAGLVLGLGLVIMFELRDSSVRNELDVEACLDLPTLVSLPFVYDANDKSAVASGNGNPKSWTRTENDHESSAKMGV